MANNEISKIEADRNVLALQEGDEDEVLASLASTMSASCQVIGA